MVHLCFHPAGFPAREQTADGSDEVGETCYEKHVEAPERIQ